MNNSRALTNTTSMQDKNLLENEIIGFLTDGIFQELCQFLHFQDLSALALTNKQIFAKLEKLLLSGNASKARDDYFAFLSKRMLSTLNESWRLSMLNESWRNGALNNNLNNFFHRLSGHVTSNLALQHLQALDAIKFDKLIFDVRTKLRFYEARERRIISHQIFSHCQAIIAIAVFLSLAYGAVEAWLISEAYINDESHGNQNNIPINDTLCSRPEVIYKNGTICNLGYGKYGESSIVVGAMAPPLICIAMLLLAFCCDFKYMKKPTIVVTNDDWASIKRQVDGLLQHLNNSPQFKNDETIATLSVISKILNKKSISLEKLIGVLSTLITTVGAIAAISNKVRSPQAALSFFKKPDVSLQIEDGVAADAAKKSKCSAFTSCLKGKKS